MPYILVLIGLVGFLGCVIWLIVNAIRWDSKIPPLIGMLVCFVLLIAGFVLVPSPAEQNKPEETEQEDFLETETGGPPEEDAPQDSFFTTDFSETEDVLPNDENDGEISVDLAIAVLKISLGQNFGEDNYTLDYDDTGVTVNVWGDNVALGAASAVTGNKDALESWNYLVSSQITFCNSIRDQFDDIGKSDYNVMLNVINDVDKSKTLLSVFNGVVIYDAVNG